MGKLKFKTLKHHSLFVDIASSTCLIGATAGIVFGVSAGTFKVNYVTLANSETRLQAANSKYNYYSQDIKCEWNMDKAWNPNSMEIKNSKAKAGSKFKSGEWWKTLHNNADPLSNDQFYNEMELDTTYGDDISDKAKRARYKYGCMVIDGATHSTMDHSFNQSLYNGLVDYIQNKPIASTELEPETFHDPVAHLCAPSYKPSADNTTEFINIFTSCANNYRVVTLAGFNHVSPLNALCEYNTKTLKMDYSDPIFDGTAFLLIDGDIPNNQNISSCLFRADQPAFLCSLATCEYFMNNLDIYHKDFKEMSLGLYGGNPLPAVLTYMGGVERGIEFYNYFILWQNLLNDKAKKYVVDKQDIEQFDDWNKKPILNMFSHSKYKDEINNVINMPKGEECSSAYDELALKLFEEYSIKVIKLGDASTHFSGSFNAGDAIGITKQFLNRGASCIISVAGPQALDSAQEIQNQKADCIVVGVDSALEEGDFQRPYKHESTDQSVAPDKSTPAQKDNIIKFSAVKNMVAITDEFMRICGSGKNFNMALGDQGEELEVPHPSRSICGPGYKTCGNIQNGLISISWDGWCPLVSALLTLDNCLALDKNIEPDSRFIDVWRSIADSYLEVIHQSGTELDKDFEDNVPYLDRLLTYNKDQYHLNKNYDHLMAILGETLNNTAFRFPAELNVKTIRDNDGKWIRSEKAEGLEDVTILQWLKNNMYFSY